MKTSHLVGGLVVSAAGLVLAYGSISGAQQPGRTPTRRVEGQIPPGAVPDGDRPVTLNRERLRRVQGGPTSGRQQVDGRSGQVRIERQVVRPGLRRLPIRPAARWRLGINTDNAPLGLRIDGVSRSSPAHRFGLEEGDYVLDVMGYPVGFYGNNYYPLAEALNQFVRRDGWVNILVWNKRTNNQEAMWIQAESRGVGIVVPQLRSTRSSKN